MPEKKGQPPKDRIRSGPFTLNYWGEDGQYAQYSIQKSWRSKDGEWRNSQPIPFYTSQLPAFKTFLIQAKEFINDLEKQMKEK